MASVWDDFMLGLYGLADTAAGAVGVETTLAADLYAEQTAQAGQLSDEQRAELARIAADATRAGALEEARAQTFDKVAESVTNLGGGLKTALYVGAGALVLVGGGLLVARVFGGRR